MAGEFWRLSSSLLGARCAAVVARLPLRDPCLSPSVRGSCAHTAGVFARNSPRLCAPLRRAAVRSAQTSVRLSIGASISVTHTHARCHSPPSHTRVRAGRAGFSPTPRVTDTLLPQVRLVHIKRLRSRATKQTKGARAQHFLSQILQCFVVSLRTREENFNIFNEISEKNAIKKCCRTTLINPAVTFLQLFWKQLMTFPQTPAR